MKLSDDNEHTHISGFEKTKITTEDEIIDIISLMGNNKIPTAIAVGEKYTHFISDLYKFNEINKIEEGALLSSTNEDVDSYDYHVLKGGDNIFSEMRVEIIHSFYKNDDKDEE